MTGMLETPSRVWRRIQDTEGRDMPSLPSLPAFEDSGEPETESTVESEDEVILTRSVPFQSTPAAQSMHKTASTIRPPSSISSTARFAPSVVSRASKSSFSSSGGNSSWQRGALPDRSFDISDIPHLPSQSAGTDVGTDTRSSERETADDEYSLQEVYLPPGMTNGDELDISEALAPMSRSNSPLPDSEPTPKKKYDYSVSLKSEPKASPYDKVRNVSFRRPLSRPPSRIRTPSLTHTLSPNSSLSNSTPPSTRSYQYPGSQNASPLPAFSVPLPRSATASPTAGVSPRGTPQEHHDDHIRPAYEDQERSERDMSIVTDPDREELHTNDLEMQHSGHGRIQTEDEREPTFSSDEGLGSPTGDFSQHDGSPDSFHSLIASSARLATAYSSPAPSMTFTPTPAVQPRPRARFTALPESTTPQDAPNEESQSSDETDSAWRQKQHTGYEGAQEGSLALQTPIPATPYAHKRSFLLSVINSTARPRMKFLPTPHPRRIVNDSPSMEGEEAENQEPTTPYTILRAVDDQVGATPHPRGSVRRRLSRPLWGARIASAATRSDSGNDQLDDRASVISTTSSQDLTTHARANASFDPVMGLGERGGHGVGRFNAGKLNSYLHGLNRKLQEENEALVERLRTFEAKVGVMEEHESGKSDEAESKIPGTSQLGPGRRFSGGGRRISAGPLGLNDVAEEAAEVWGEEKAELEDVIDELKEMLEKTSAEKGVAERMLEDEREERARDKERWRDRMGEVEKGVEGIVRELENKQREAEHRAKTMESDKALAIKGLERQLSEVVAERDTMVERLEQAEVALNGGKGLDLELRTANERVGKVMSDLKSSNLQIHGLEEEVSRVCIRVDTLEKELGEERCRSAELQVELISSRGKMSQSLQQITASESELSTLREEVAKSKSYIGQLEGEGRVAAHQVEELQEELSRAEQEAETHRQDLELERKRISQLESETYRAAQLATQLKEALEAAEAKMQTDDEQIMALKVKIGTLERELDKSQPTHFGLDSDAQAEIDALESELADANKEVARLDTLLAHSPARRAIAKVKDSKIEILEREKKDLQDRLRALKNSSSTSLSTPLKLANGSSISPMHRQILAMSFRSPKTPGDPLRDLSWLQTTMDDPTTAHLFAEIERLQQELDRANESIDEKLERLEDAGVGVIQLTNLLEEARAKILVMENTLGHISRREERRVRRLEKLRCQKCQIKVDLKGLYSNTGDGSSILEASTLSLPTEPPTPPTRTSDKLRTDIQAVNGRLFAMQQQWAGERHRLIGENTILQDATKRLNLEIRGVKSELQRLQEMESAEDREGTAMECAKTTVDILEANLKAERSRLRELMTEQTGVEREKEKIALQLRRTESDMTDVKEQLLKVKHQNHTLEAELRGIVEQKARRLEARVAENTDTIEQLRQERSLLASDHKMLQKRYVETSDQITKMREKFAALQSLHDNRRHQLDLQGLELDQLRAALTHQATELQRASEEHARIQSEKIGVGRSVESLEADLRRVKHDAEVFGTDLKMLKQQKDRLVKEKEEAWIKTERAEKQNLAQIRILKEELEVQKAKARDAEELWNRHVCEADEGQLTALRVQHKSECKGLIVQIRYLKAKFTRESAIRADLTFQKRYLLALLARSERTENKILAVIATIGYPPSASFTPIPTKKRSLKSVVLSVLFLGRARRASASWREQCSSKDAVASALQEVRRRRVTATVACSSRITTNASTGSVDGL